MKREGYTSVRKCEGLAKHCHMLMLNPPLPFLCYCLVQALFMVWLFLDTVLGYGSKMAFLASYANAFLT